MSQIVGDHGRDPGECEAGVSPLFEPGPPRDHNRDRPQQFGDPKENPQLGWIPDVGKSLHRLRGNERSDRESGRSDSAFSETVASKDGVHCRVWLDDDPGAPTLML